MRNTHLIALLIGCFTSLPLLSQTSNTGTLEISFSDVRNDRGEICIGINTSPDGWPRKAQLERKWEKKELNKGVLVVEVPDLPYGTYAISVLDDENSNHEIDMTLGIPGEGFGFSQNPKVGLSAPKFEDCSFKIDSAMTRITIQLKYIGKSK